MHAEQSIKEDVRNIIIKGARVNNLKNIDVVIPRNKLTVITGLSGSGKTSLAFDTLFAEGQRRYVESLSSYARQFLGRIAKPEVDYINGISPAIAIEQKTNNRNPRSTVGTTTEVYEYMKLLFARIGKTYSPVSENVVKRHSVSDVVDFINKLSNETKVFITISVNTFGNRSIDEQLQLFKQQGFTRVIVNNQIFSIDELKDVKHKNSDKIELLIDRLIIDKSDNELNERIADSVQTAFNESGGYCNINFIKNEKFKSEQFSSRFELDGIIFEEPSVNFFSFNNPYGACKNCEGFGTIIGIDEDLVIPNKYLSIYEDAVACWRGEKMENWKTQLVNSAYLFDFPIHKPYIELSHEQKRLLWEGNEYFEGLNIFFKRIEEQSFKIQYRVMLSRYRGKTVCPECKGSRLRKDASYVKIGEKSIIDIVLMSVSEGLSFFKQLMLNEYELKVAKRIIIEIKNRLQTIEDVGLGYLTLNRLSSSLSGGETQRLNLATSLGSSLVGSMYILDEPSVGLHPRDTHRLISVLQKLKSLGNTVIVVEHDEEIMKAADNIIDMGPFAGENGGEVVFSGNFDEILNINNSLTGDYLKGLKSIELPEVRKKWKDYLFLEGVSENNLKNISVKIPLNAITVVSGVSGSGKSSLVRNVLFPALRSHYEGHSEKIGKFLRISGDLKKLVSVEYIDQNPIVKSSRSNPATYVKAFDEIRMLFSEQSLAKARGYKQGYFSFNIEGGRCEECEGEGFVKIEMQFMADLKLICESCKGKRFKEEVLDIKYKDKNIFDVLEMTVEHALDFFNTQKKSSTETQIVQKLTPLSKVGLGYIKLGQPSSSLSGGEAQRIKLATFLNKGFSDKPTLFIFDEPTTGLHFHDISKLKNAFDELIGNGHTVLIVEHNLDIIKTADWVIELGPEGGNGGGYIVFEGLPDDLAHCNNSYTSKFLKQKLLK